MAMPNELQSVLNQNSGIVTTAQANEVGVSNERLRLLVHSGDLERVTTGIYVLQELRQKAHTELAWLQPWDEWRLRGKTYCSLNLIPIQCVYEPNI